MRECLGDVADKHPLMAFVLYQMAAAVLLVAAVAAFTCICTVPVYLLTKVM